MTHFIEIPNDDDALLDWSSLVVYRSFCNFIFDRFVVGTVELWSRDQRVWSSGG